MCKQTIFAFMFLGLYFMFVSGVRAYVPPSSPLPENRTF